MSNSKTKKLKNIICSLTLAFGLMVSALSGLTFAKTQGLKVSAETSNYSNNYIKKNVYEDNSSSANYFSFYTTSTSRPANANGWTEIEDEDRVSYTDANVVRGIVDLTPNNSTWSKEIYHTT